MSGPTTLAIRRTAATGKVRRSWSLSDHLRALGIAVDGLPTRDHIRTAHKIFRAAKGASVEINVIWTKIKKHICPACDGVKFHANQATCCARGRRKAVAIAAACVVACASFAAQPRPLALPVSTNKPASASFAWDNPGDATIAGYKLYWGVRTGVYTNAIDTGRATSATITNLNARARYYVAATSYNTSRVESVFSKEVTWPAYFTNYVTVGFKTNGKTAFSVTLTNPPGDVALFTPFIWQTNDLVSVIKIDSRNLVVANTNQP